MIMGGGWEGGGGGGCGVWGVRGKGWVGVNVGIGGEPSSFYLFDDGYDLCGVIRD